MSKSGKQFRTFTRDRRAARQHKQGQQQFQPPTRHRYQLDDALTDAVDFYDLDENLNPRHAA